MKTYNLCAAIAAMASLIAAAALPTTPKGFTDDLDAALKRSSRSGRPVVAVFSGSDWCIWCRRLEREILSKDEFLRAATNKYELVFIDNPEERNVIPDRAMKRNSMLVEKYNVDGFPTVLVFDSAGKTIASLGYEKNGPARFLENIENAVRGRK